MTRNTSHGDDGRPLNLADVADPADGTTPIVQHIAETQALPTGGNTTALPVADTSVLPPAATTLPLGDPLGAGAGAGTGAGAGKPTAATAQPSTASPSTSQSTSRPAGSAAANANANANTNASASVDTSASASANEPIVQPIAAQPQTQPQQSQPATAPISSTPAQGAGTDPRSQAWRQQGDAARGYADEATRNGYPGWNGYQPSTGAGAPPQTPAQGMGAATGFAQSGPTQPGNGNGNGSGNGTPGTVYKQGISVGTVVLGVALVVVGAYGVALLVFPSLFITARLWSVLLAALLAIAGVALVVGAVANALRNQKKDGTAPSE